MAVQEEANRYCKENLPLQELQKDTQWLLLSPAGALTYCSSNMSYVVDF